MPGSGPTDPEILKHAIDALAEYHEGRLYTARDGERWIAAADIGGREMWVLTFTRGAVLLAPGAFDKLQRGRVKDGFVHVDGMRYALVPPALDAPDQTAYLMPA
jgi:hypothetical protein